MFGFGAVAVAAGLLALVQSMQLAAALGLAFLAGGYFTKATSPRRWAVLASVWMVVGALALAGSIAALLDRPLGGSLAAAAILFGVGLIAESHLLMAVAPIALAAAIGGSTGYWDACYEIAVREPTLTIAFFSLLAFGAWRVGLSVPPRLSALALTVARVSVILVNFGFWVGSLWGDTPGRLWDYMETLDWTQPRIPALFFAAAWAIVLLAAGAWGARNGRRFLVNAAATFAAINFYTQWFEHLGLDPLTVIGGGVAAIGAGYALWRYNARAAAA